VAQFFPPPSARLPSFPVVYWLDTKIENKSFGHHP